MTADKMNIFKCSPTLRKGVGLHFFVLPAFVLLLLAGGCKPTEKNYRTAYDVAREKRDRDMREREELRQEMGMADGMLRETDGYTLTDVGDEQVWVRHLNFARADSVAMYAVGVGCFRMDTNAKALAGDLVAQGWKEARCAGADKSWYVIVGESAEQGEALAMLRRFREREPKWQYVGLPGIALLIGGSR